MENGNQPIHYWQFTAGQWKDSDGETIIETPVSLTVNGEVWLTFMCTPVDLEAMAVGFLFNEGVIESMTEVADVRVCPTRDNIDVWLEKNASKPEQWRRTSGCTGGFTSIEPEAIPAGDGTEAGLRLYNGALLEPEKIGALVGQLFVAQELYKRSGGVHTSALSDGKSIRVVVEDIGRHNTLDKLAGRCLLDGIELPQRIVITTGRISSEMLQKSVRMGAAVVISRTSPSSLSIKLARQWGVTLIGYARRDRFNVYAHPERLLTTTTEESHLEIIDKIKST